MGMSNKYSNIMIKDPICYDGKLNTHKSYLKMLDILMSNSKFIGITSNHEIIDIFKDDIISIEKSHSWWGIETSYYEELYYIKASKELFNYLKKYDTFCKYIVDYINGDYVETTEFGINDIAFFDNKNNILFRTNTHEGFLFVSKLIDEKFNKEN